MPIISIEKLNNANLDAETIEQVVNGEPNVLVESRGGRKIPTLATLGEKHLSAGVILYGGKTQEQVNDEVGNALTGLSFANKTYATVAAANEDIANIAVNQSVWVSSATEGGLYEKKTADATSVVKSAFDPVEQAKDFTNSRLEFKNKLYGYAELYKTIKQNETYVDNGTGQYGGFTFKDAGGSEATATFYIDVTITTKGDANALVLYSGTTSIKTLDASQGFAQGARLKFVWQATKITSGGDVDLFAQVRTRYPTSQTMNATIKVNYFGAFKGVATQAEIEKYLSGDETTVQKAALATKAETADTALVANTFVDYPLDVKKKLFGHAELIKNVYKNSPYADSGTGSLGGQTFYDSSPDVDIVMCYVDVTISNIGSATGLQLMSGVSTVKEFTAADGFVNGGRIKFAWKADKITGEVNKNLLMQVRTKYASSSSVRDATLFYNNLSYYKDGVTQAQIEKTIIDDTAIVQLADQALLANRALIADSVDDIPASYLNKVTFDADRTKTLASPSTGIQFYKSITAEAVSNAYEKLEDGKFKIGATVNTSVTNPRFWYGFQIPVALLTSATKWYLVLRGKFTSSGLYRLTVATAGGLPDVNVVNSIFAEDIIDNQERSFETIIPISYTAGYTGNGRYIYINPSVRVAGSVYTLAMEFDSFGIVKSTELSDMMGLDEYRTLQNDGEYSYIKGKKLDPNLATKGLVEERISAQKVSKLTPNDFKTKCDIEMVLTYGQSLGVGGTASDINTDFKNALTFVGGTNVWNIAFSSQAEKDAYFGSDFVSLNKKITEYPPATAAVRAMIQLAQEENQVDVTAFNYYYIPQTGGLSGEEIIKMNKGTKPYSDILEVVAKAKSFASKKGLTFRVAVLNWVQGEADKDKAAGYYYPLLEQLFTDFNNDIKTITGQTDDVNIITYQTSPLKGVYTPSGSATKQPGDYDNPVAAMHVSNAQVAIANNKANVFCCGAMYQYEYSDLYHPKDRAVVGLQQGIAAKRIIHEGKEWVTFQPISHEVIHDNGNYFLRLKFDVPCKPMRFDISGDKYHNPNGKQPNFGFKVLNASGVDIIASEPTIVKGDTLVIKCSQNPVGSTVTYAVNGHYGGGNLCDSQGINITNKTQSYTIDNFCVAFDNYVI